MADYGLQYRPKRPIPAETNARLAGPAGGLRYRPQQMSTGLMAGQTKPGAPEPWRAVGAQGLSGLARMLMSYGAGRPEQAGEAFSGGMADAQVMQQRREQQMREAELYGMQVEEFQTGKADKAEAKSEAARVKRERDAAIDRLPVDDATKAMLKATDSAPSYGDLVPKAAGPQSGLAKLKADLDAGLIDKPTYDAAVKKENRIPRDPQGPIQWSDIKDDKGRIIGQRSSAGQVNYFDDAPGDDGGGPFGGTSMDAQASNILLTGDPASPEYSAAYAHLAQSKVTIDPVTQELVTISPDLSWAAPPQRGGAPTMEPQGGRPGPTVQNAQGLPPEIQEMLQPTVPPIPGAESFSVPGATVTTRPGTPVFNEGQGNSATFADRIAASNDVLDTEGAAGTSPIQQGLSGIPLVGNYLMSGERQRFEQAERDFINAQLRRESGAVISPEEFANARQQYIPQPGDDAPTRAQKKASRERALRGMERAAGPAYKPQPRNKGATETKGGTRVDKLPPGNWQ